MTGLEELCVASFVLVEPDTVFELGNCIPAEVAALSDTGSSAVCETVSGRFEVAAGISELIGAAALFD